MEHCTEVSPRSGTADHLGHEESFSKHDQALACIERLMTEVQRSFDPSILERQVTAAADFQAFQVTGSNQSAAVVRSPEVDCAAAAVVGCARLTCAH